MAPKKKKNKLLVKLISGAGTGFFYLFKKTPAIAQKKLALRKFDPIVNQYVIFNEAKLKFSTTVSVPNKVMNSVQYPKPNFTPLLFSSAPTFFNHITRLATWGIGTYVAFSFCQPMFQRIQHQTQFGYAHNPEQFPRIVAVQNPTAGRDVIETTRFEIVSPSKPETQSQSSQSSSSFLVPMHQQRLTLSSQTPTTTRLQLIREIQATTTQSDSHQAHKAVFEVEKI